MGGITGKACRCDPPRFGEKWTLEVVPSFEKPSERSSGAESPSRSDVLRENEHVEGVRGIQTTNEKV